MMHGKLKSLLISSKLSFKDPNVKLAQKKKALGWNFFIYLDIML